MKNSVKLELSAHVIDKINDGVLTNENKEDHHFYAFNEDYFLIGYFECSEWLKKHDFEQLEAAQICIDYEVDNFGESNTKYDNTEKVVNMLAYIFGEELLNSIDYDTIEELKEKLG